MLHSGGVRRDDPLGELAESLVFPRLSLVGVAGSFQYDSLLVEIRNACSSERAIITARIRDHHLENIERLFVLEMYCGDGLHALWAAV